MTAHEGQTCIGCGALLQNRDEAQPHYVPKPLNEAPLSCMRCRRITHHNAVSPRLLDTQTYVDLIGPLLGKDVLVVLVLDLFDIEHALECPLADITRKDVLVVATKRDILPKSVSDAKLSEKLRTRVEEAGWQPLDIVLCSAAKRHGTDTLRASLGVHAAGRDIVFIGPSGAGKSRLANVLRGKGAIPFTTSAAHGTTQRPMAFELGAHTCYDTPGYTHPTRLASCLPAAVMANSTPKEEIRPRTYNLEDAQTLIVGGLIRLDRHGPDSVGFIVYAARNVSVHRTKTSRADDILKQRETRFEILTGHDDIATLSKRTVMSVSADEDIVLGGFAFIRVLKETDVVIHHLPGVVVWKRQALIG